MIELQDVKEEERSKKMKINWFGLNPVIQRVYFEKNKRIVEPVDKSSEINNNIKEEDNYQLRSNENDEERQDYIDYWKVFWKI